MKEVGTVFYKPPLTPPLEKEGKGGFLLEKEGKGGFLLEKEGKGGFLLDKEGSS